MVDPTELSRQGSRLRRVEGLGVIRIGALWEGQEGQESTLSANDRVVLD